MTSNSPDGRRTDGRVCGAVILDGDGQTVEVMADLVVGADGIGSTVARLVGARVLWEGRHTTAVIYGHCRGLRAAAYSWHYRKQIGAGVIPTNGGAHCAFVAVPPARFRDEIRHDIAAGFSRAPGDLSASLAADVVSARFEAVLSVFAGHRGLLREAWRPGWALVGDAGYFTDPLTAHGMTDALRDAELLAGAAVQGSAGPYHRTTGVETLTVILIFSILAIRRRGQRRDRICCNKRRHLLAIGCRRL
jgi:2-polyprenyl-6-methoxyphenol hydroxylase-like FAD-dependent oxidoreductase